MADPNSVFHYYQKLIALRKKYPVVVYGKYELLLPEDEELFVYTRTNENEKLLVVCSFTEQERTIELPEEFIGAGCIISNMDNSYEQKEVTLKPYEAFVLYRK